MKIELHFNLAQGESSKVAQFQSIEEKKDYVAAETKNLKCQELYFKYQAARTLEERRQIATEIDTTRWLFFLNWKNKGKLKVVDSGPGAA